MKHPPAHPTATLSYGDGVATPATSLDAASRGPSTGASPITVSIAGGESARSLDGVRSGLTDAASMVKQINELQAAIEQAKGTSSSTVSPSQDSAAKPPPRPVNDLEPVLLAASGAKSRNVAIEEMVNWFAKGLPGVSVRCGYGTHKLKRMYDSRLGWIGNESSLYRDVAESWTEIQSREESAVLLPSEITIRLTRPGTESIAILRMAGKSVSEPMMHRMCMEQSLLGSIVLGRPAFHAMLKLPCRGRGRWMIGMGIAVVVALLLCPVPYRAACKVRVEPIDARVVSAPFEATIQSVHVEPGDNVTLGQPLVELDGRPLRLEQQSVDAEIQQFSKQRDVAMAAGKIAEGQLAQLKCQQLSRQRELIQRRLDQLVITSPVAGTVVAGDLRRSIGVPLETGQVLFEIASLDRVLLEIEIPEHEIGLVDDQSAVRVRVDSSRSGSLDAALDQIYPAAVLRDGKSIFVAPLEIDNSSHGYRPGMTGLATVYGPIRPWSWTHIRGLVDQATWLMGL